MLLRSLLTIVMLVSLSPVVCGQYQIELSARAGGSQSYVDDSTNFTLVPTITALEGGVSTNAFITLSSPNDRSMGFVNHPQNTSARASHQPDTASVVSETNGTWRVTIEDDAATFNYEVDITLALPFADLPYFSSASLVNGKLVGEFSWSLEGGSPTYPGSASGIRARLLTTAFAEIDAADLASGATSWTPVGDLAAEQEFLGTLLTINPAIDTTALTIGGIRALTPGAPALIFSQSSLAYTASRSAKLVAVPEPSSAAMILMAAAAVGWGLRRSARAH